MNKILKVCIIMSIVIGVFALKFFNKNEEVGLETYSELVFSDSNDNLIPISIPYNSAKDFEMDLKNKFIIMQSDDFSSYGLKPVLSKNLVLNYAYKDNGTLYMDFNDELYSNAPMDIIELISYMVKDESDIENVQLSINDKIEQYFPNSYLPMKFNSKDLGLNNFIDVSKTITKSESLTFYKKMINNNEEIFVPYTLRVDDSCSFQDKINQLLSKIDSSIEVEKVKYEDKVAEIYLSSNILLDNETVDSKLEECIYLSVLSIDEVNDIKLFINNEQVSQYNGKEICINFIE